MGWLAAIIKQRLGSGVLVFCGNNPERGEIFVYLGYPLEVATDVRDLIDELRGLRRGLLDLDLRLFQVVETSPTSAISKDTTFEFRERNGVVEASYSGGQIISGVMTGRREGDHVAIAYAQLDDKGTRRTGTSEWRIEQTAKGSFRLREDFTWSDGTRGSNVLESAETISNA